MSAGSTSDASALLAPGVVGVGIVDPAHDVGNAYAYVTFNSQGQMLIYVALERLISDEATTVTFELPVDRL